MKYYKDSWLLFAFQVIAHLSLIPALIFFSWKYFIISLFVYFITGCFGMTMTYHRLLTHKSWTAPRWFVHVGSLCGAYGLVGSPIAWVSIHREHHAFTETDLDPHSPHTKGFFNAQYLSMFNIPKLRYVVDLVRDNFQIKLHQYYFLIHGIIFTTLLVLNPMLLLFAYLVPAAILWNAGSFINTLNHTVGYRNSETRDNSTNNFLTGYLMWGEGWHNNHHASPKNWNFQVRPWEFDIGGFFIKRLMK